MTTNSDYENFISRIRKTGMPTASKFFVFVPGLGSSSIMMMCDATSIPGQNLMTNDVRINGELTEMPYGIIYPTVAMSFYIDNSMTIKRNLDAWLKQVYDKDARSVGYYSNFTRQVDVFLTDASGQVIYCSRLNECYPKSMSDIHLSYSSANAIIKIDVTLAYKWWDAMAFNKAGEPIATQASIINGLDSSSLLYDYTTNNINFQKQFGETIPEVTVSDVTGIISPVGLPVGSGKPTIPIVFSPNLPSGLGTLGKNIPNVFSSVANGGAAAFKASPLNSTFANQMATEFSNISTNMQQYGAGIVNLGKNLTSITAPLSQISGSITSLSGTLTSVDNAFNSVGLGKPFLNVTSQLNYAAGKLGVVSNLRGVPSQLASVGASLSATGAKFNSTITTIKNIPGYTSQIGKYMSKMGDTFSSAGSDTSNAASGIDSWVSNSNSGEI